MKLQPMKAIWLPLVAAALIFAPAARAHDGDHTLPTPRDARGVTEEVLVGEGAETYQSVPNWCQLPEGHKDLGSTHGGVVVDKKGLIYFSMEGGEFGILVYSPDGKLAKSIAPKMTGMHGLCINEENGEEFIYAAHLSKKQAVKMKLDGTVVWTIPIPKESGKYDDAKKQIYNPTAIAVAPDGSVFVADGYGQNWIHKFDKDQKYVKSFGGKGTKPGEFQTCHGLAIDRRDPAKPLLIVCDRENRRLQHFDFDGNFVAVITTELRRPCSISFNGDHAAIAELEGRVAIIDKDNKVVTTLGDNPDKKQWATNRNPPAVWKEGIFNAPHGISYDHDGNLLIEDWNTSGRIYRFNKVGEKAQARAD
jgi:sugar lactone lactonase YvrE